MRDEVVGYVIALLGVASSGEAIPQPCYVLEGDADFVGPNPQITGQITKTGDLGAAKMFATWDDAVSWWQTTSTVLPTRPDGKPNRPFTAYHVEFIQVRAIASDTP